MIHVVIGTKAQFIKMAPIMVKLKEEGLPYRFIHTGQHRATIDEILREFRLGKPDLVLYDGPDIVSLPQMFSWLLRMLWKCPTAGSRVFDGDRRGMVLVHGDTFSTLVGALMGRAAGLPVGHIESGLRSYSLLHPFPEELTRLLALRLSTTLFCPGDWALGNVSSLGKRTVDTHLNTMADTVALASRTPLRHDHVPREPFALVSLHRYENIFRKATCDRILTLLEIPARSRRLLFILHPPTEARLRHYGFSDRLTRGGRIELRPRYSYFDFFALMKSADFVITDGGSIQEESSYMGTPCLLMRRATERREGLGRNVVLSNYDPAIIEDFSSRFRQYRHAPLVSDRRPSDIIVSYLKEYA